MSNPQTHDLSNPEPLWPINASWVNGIAPGYWPTAGVGLNLKLSAGTANNAGTIISYAGGTLSLTDNATNYVFLDSASSYAPGSNTTGFTSAHVPIATVVTSGGAITSITDHRLAAFIGGTITAAQIQQESLIYASDVGAANAYAVTISPVPSLIAGSVVVFKAANANTGASTLAVNGGAAIPIKKSGSTALASGDIAAGQIIVVIYDGTNLQLIGSSSSGGGGSSELVIGFVINNGAVGNNVGAMLVAPQAGAVSKCVIVTKASDGTTGLTFRIKKNGTDVFTIDPSVAAGTASGTTSSSSSLTSSPLSVAAGDVFQIDILNGSPNWQFTAQLET